MFPVNDRGVTLLPYNKTCSHVGFSKVCHLNYVNWSCLGKCKYVIHVRLFVDGNNPFTHSLLLMTYPTSAEHHRIQLIHLFFLTFADLLIKMIWAKEEIIPGIAKRRYVLTRSSMSPLEDSLEMKMDKQSF